MEKNVKISMLNEIYGKLLTTKQYEIIDNYYNQDLSLSEIKGYNAKRLLFITYVYIYDKNNKCYTFSGFPAKKLQIWLKQIGIRKLS